MSHLHQETLDLASLLTETDDPKHGALVVFGGTVRNENLGRAVTGISYSAHPTMAENILSTLEQECLKRFDIGHCRILHRIGDLALGDVSVLVVVRAAHRAAAFDAARYAIDTLKRRAPIWKQEHYEGGDSHFLDGVSLDRTAQQDP